MQPPRYMRTITAPAMISAVLRLRRLHVTQCGEVAFQISLPHRGHFI
jgi:hypothetical protein